MTADTLVLVVDDDESVRTGLTRVLRSAGYAVEAFEGARQLLSRLPSVDLPCCIVSDVRMPGMDGLALLEELGSGTAPALVFLTGFADVPTTLRAMKHGALDLLEKPVSSDVLLAAVAAAIERALKNEETRHRVHDLRERYRTLTPRERQVFALVTAGLLNKQVGYELGTSEKTVKVQRARVIEKMGARSLADLVRMADRLGIAASVDGAPAGEVHRTAPPTELAAHL
ncbi:response regulator transcription factor [Anaeromyxobacter oryzae]|uniref:DNA-binding response regulator n=1 Tax=Anaeromyxobacter oryzae TaxID=2918170 RepID=A0ABN6MX99_9BACT|nr:response regulator [Anaeromyxobacter oryzae]BDG05612.1 DNA-binding response regulator [Anaeromyxobacter oryzae]